MHVEFDLGWFKLEMEILESMTKSVTMRSWRQRLFPKFVNLDFVFNRHLAVCVLTVHLPSGNNIGWSNNSEIISEYWFIYVLDLKNIQWLFQKYTVRHKHDVHLVTHPRYGLILSFALSGGRRLNQHILFEHTNDTTYHYFTSVVLWKGSSVCLIRKLCRGMLLFKWGCYEERVLWMSIAGWRMVEAECRGFGWIQLKTRWLGAQNVIHALGTSCVGCESWIPEGALRSSEGKKGGILVD